MMRQNDRNIQWDTSPYMARQTLQSAHPLQMGLEAQGDGPQERRAEDALVTEGEGEQKGNPFLCSDLVLTSHVKKYVFPTVAPVFRQTGGYSLGRLVRRKKMTSGRMRIISQASSRHGSASGKKKSEVMHTQSISPRLILYWPRRSFWSG